MTRLLLCVGASLLVLGMAAAPLRAGFGGELATVESAAEVVRAFSEIPIQSIPPAMLRNAAGVAIIPHVVKAGFLIGGRFGRGVVLARRPDGSWSEPVFITLAGGGFGLQAGIQSTDVVLVFKTAHSVDQLLRGYGKLTLGGDIAVAAGPVGRQAEAATDGVLQAEIYSYSRSRGLFAGVSLEGAGLVFDGDASAAFVSLRGTPPAAIVVGDLMTQLNRLTAPPPPLVPLPIPAAPPPLPLQPIPVPSESEK